MEQAQMPSSIQISYDKGFAYTCIFFLINNPTPYLL